MRVYTIGHSTHSLDEFAALLERHGVKLVADVRRHPGSRRHPQFGAEALAAGLEGHGVGYRHLPGLGGRRSARADSPNDGWDVPAFRAYADYALTEEFGAALDELCALARERPAAVMCAEGLWWQCHRRLIADRLVVARWTVCHIAPDGDTTEHELTEFAHVGLDGTIRYPAPQLRL